MLFRFERDILCEVSSDSASDGSLMLHLLEAGSAVKSSMEERHPSNKPVRVDLRGA